ncbi:hypothetical protein CEW89_01350 [Celeribacter ethanolicus]|uniref:Uncharacterized protein n=1 Tax=Celeribacter ethanolicus TaxID=1758178 RepID=A0A291G8H0_9RHOB|nr:hypothetical protein [Celeribacter ethanolicus]ATG46330.1 hypothetical protein CEW89_01350 [Celeribacter ethanolicus]
MTENLSTKIAGNRTVGDWKAQRDQLSQGATVELWEETYVKFLKTRLYTRYLGPIDWLKDQTNGEGFTIVSIQCALIEFLAALKVGKNYRFPQNGEQLSAHEYSKSKELFCDFLSSSEPFKEWFVSEDVAVDFYANVRCGLLHEARTKGGWKIKASGDVAIDYDKKVVYRKQLDDAIREYLCNYKEKLKSDPDLQAAFIRKFNHLCDL